MISTDIYKNEQRYSQLAIIKNTVKHSKKNQALGFF